MNRKTTTTSKTQLLRAAFFLALLFLVIQLMPRVVGQRRTPEALADICPWQLVANMPLDLYGAAGASNGTFSYHAGGYSFSVGFPGTVNVFNRYDPVLNTWTALAPMPDSLSLMASAVYYPTTNKIYVFGGEDGDFGVNSNATRIYDIASNTWSAGTPMPDVRSFMASGYNSANGKIYLVSGYNTGFVDSAQPNTWEFDPAANGGLGSFTERAPFPHPAGGMASGFINGKLYVAGGRDAANTVINLNWEFDPVANTWTAKANMPGTQNNVRGSAVAVNNLWVFGGGNPFGPTGNGASTKAAFARERVKGQPVPDTTTGASRYDPATDTWSSAPDMNVQRSFPSGAAISSKLVAAGGYDGTFTVASAEKLDAGAVCTPTPSPCDSALIVNGGFETGTFPPWVIDGHNNDPVISNAQAHSGTFSAAAGDFGPFPSGEPFGDSSFYQEFTVPATGGTLSFWHWDFTTDSITFDWQDAYITNSSGTILQTIFHQCRNGQTWINKTVDMTPYAGQTVRIKFLVHQDGFGDDTGMYVDDVQLLIPCPPITLTATGRRLHGRNVADLYWTFTPTISGSVDIYRDGVLIATVPEGGNSGSYTDYLFTLRGGNLSFTYKVCYHGTTNCSNEATVRFGGPH